MPRGSPGAPAAQCLCAPRTNCYSRRVYQRSLHLPKHFACCVAAKRANRAALVLQVSQDVSQALHVSQDVSDFARLSGCLSGYACFLVSQDASKALHAQPGRAHHSAPAPACSSDHFVCMFWRRPCSCAEITVGCPRYAPPGAPNLRCKAQCQRAHTVRGGAPAIPSCLPNDALSARRNRSVPLPVWGGIPTAEPESRPQSRWGGIPTAEPEESRPQSRIAWQVAAGSPFRRSRFTALQGPVQTRRGERRGERRAPASPSPSSPCPTSPLRSSPWMPRCLRCPPATTTATATTTNATHWHHCCHYQRNH